MFLIPVAHIKVSKLLYRLFIRVCEKYQMPFIVSDNSPVEVGTASHCVVCEMLLALLVPKVFQGVGPQQITHRSVRWRLFESV